MAIARQTSVEGQERILFDLESLDVPAFLVDKELHLRSVNDSFCELVGKARGELLGRHCHSVVFNRNCNCLRGTGQKGHLPALGLASVDGLSLLREVILPLRCGDEQAGYLVFLVPDSGEPGDISQFFQAQKLAALGVLAAGVAHELRNPLAIISTSLYFLADVLSGDDELVEKHLRIMEEEVESARRIIDDLLNFARPSGDVESEVDVNRVIAETLSLLDKELQRSDIEVITDYGSVPMVLTNLDAVRHAFLNIVTNALQAMPNGGTLTIQSRLGQGNSGDPAVVVSIADTGKGMTEDELAHAFDPFFTTKAQGTGLGLSITYSNIRRLGGDLRINSSSGKGTTVEVVLPAGGRNGVLENPSR